MHSNCNNKFEVYHYHASVVMICIPIPSEGALVYCYDFIAMTFTRSLCSLPDWGKEIIKKKPSLDSVFFQALYLDRKSVV